MQENLEELRHRETLAFLIMVMGMICLMGGMTMTVLFSNHLSWFLIFPYAAGPSNLLGLTLTLLGFSLISIGFVLAFYYDREKMWFLTKLSNSAVVKRKVMKGKKRVRSQPR